MRVSNVGSEPTSFTEVQIALQLDPESTIQCLAFMSNKRVCDEIPEYASSFRNKIIKNINKEMEENGSIFASERITTLLNRLAETLICKIKPHVVKKNGRDCVQIHHVSDILRRRLETYEETRAARRRESGAHIRGPHRDNKTRFKARRGVFEEEYTSSCESDEPAASEEGEEDGEGLRYEDDDDEDDEDDDDEEDHDEEDEDDEEEEEEEDEQEDEDERELAPAHRPKPSRRYAAIYQHQVKPKAQPYLKRQKATPASIRLQKGSSRKTRPEASDSEVPTPETVVSDTFTPASPPLSTTSVESIMTSHIRKNGRKARQRQNFINTPSRRRRASFRLSETDSDPESCSAADDDDEGSESNDSDLTPSRTYSSDDEEKYESGPVHSGDEESDLESLRHSESESEVVVQRSFERMTRRPQPVKTLMETMRRTINNNAPGYIYCFSDKSLPGYLKIGFSGIGKLNKDGAAVKEPSAMLWQRLLSQEIRCNYDTRLEYHKYMPCAGAKIEKLVHATLHEQRRRVTNCMCGSRHHEWFLVNVEKAVTVINAWKDFSELGPWDEYGSLSRTCRQYISNNINTVGTMSVECWMNGPWKGFINKVKGEQDQQEKEMKEKIQNLEDELHRAKKEKEKKNLRKKRLQREKVGLELEEVEMELEAAIQDEQDIKEHLAVEKRRLAQRNRS